jgi:hypothetical protein
MLGAPKRTPLGIIDWQAIRTQAQPVADKVGINFLLNVPIARLSPAEKWLISICRALVRKARLISMDEPTASLSIRESENLFSIIRALAGEGWRFCMFPIRLCFLRTGQSGTLRLLTSALRRVARAHPCQAARLRGSWDLQGHVTSDLADSSALAGMVGVFVGISFVMIAPWPQRGLASASAT